MYVMCVQIGKALMEALKKLVSEDKVPPGLAVRVMKAFDRVRGVRSYGENEYFSDWLSHTRTHTFMIAAR